MEKNRCMGTKPIGNVLRNTFLVMRLTVIFVCLFVLGGRASVLSQYRVNVKLGETTYKHLFEEIRKQPAVSSCTVTICWIKMQR